VTAFKARSRLCGAAEAQQRLTRAREFLEVADLAMSEQDPTDHSYVYSSAAATLAVLAGIAASDAACCNELGKRSKGESHQEAARLLREITPGGKEAASDLAVLLGLKDRAQYGAMALGGRDLRKVIRRAEKLCAFAETVLQR
jgi:hypothetical protein